MKKPHAKRRILDATDLLFSEKGYASVGINEIIAASQTAKASFYHHFPSKAALCAAWLRETHSRAVERHATILGKPGDAGEKIHHYFETLKACFEPPHSKRGCPFSNTMATNTGVLSKPIRQEITKHKEAERAFFVTLAQQLKPRPKTPPKTIGAALFLLYSGAATEAQNLGHAEPVDDALTAARLIIR